MRKPVLTIFNQFNPWHSIISGIQTVISNFIKYAPNDFEVRLIGTGNALNQLKRKWQEADLTGKRIQFMPLIRLRKDNFSNLILTTVKYTTALLGHNFAGETPNLLSAESGIVCNKRNPVAVADALSQVLLQLDNYPIEVCVRAARPYSASAVVDAVARQMWHCWEQRHLESRAQNCFTNFT